MVPSTPLNFLQLENPVNRNTSLTATSITANFWASGRANKPNEELLLNEARRDELGGKRWLPRLINCEHDQSLANLNHDPLVTVMRDVSTAELGFLGWDDVYTQS